MSHQACRIIESIGLPLLTMILAAGGASAKRLQEPPRSHESPKKETATISRLCYQQIDLCTSYVQQFETSFLSAPAQYRDEFERTADAVEEGCRTCVRQLNLQDECFSQANKACGRPSRLLRGER